MGKQIKKRCKPYIPKPLNINGFINIVRLTDQAIEHSSEKHTQEAAYSCQKMSAYFRQFLGKILAGTAPFEYVAPVLLLSEILNTLLMNKQFYYCLDDAEYAQEVYKAFNVSFKWFWERSILEGSVCFENNEYDIFRTSLEYITDKMYYLTNKDYEFVYDFAVKKVHAQGWLIEEKENGKY